jgi:hypothetical protein
MIMSELKVELALDIPSPAPIGSSIGNGIKLESYSEYCMRGITAAIVGQLGNLVVTFLTDRRLDESKVGRSILGDSSYSTGAGTFTLLANPPTQSYQCQCQDGYNWLVTAVIQNMRNGAIVDFGKPLDDLTISIAWDCKPKE